MCVCVRVCVICTRYSYHGVLLCIFCIEIKNVCYLRCIYFKQLLCVYFTIILQNLNIYWRFHPVSYVCLARLEASRVNGSVHGDNTRIKLALDYFSNQHFTSDSSAGPQRRGRGCQGAAGPECHGEQKVEAWSGWRLLLICFYHYVDSICFAKKVSKRFPMKSKR